MKNHMRIVLVVALWTSVAGSLFAQPILNRVEQLLRDELGAVRSRTVAEPGYLGVVVDDKDESGRGVRVLDLAPGSPAAKGGLQTGDLITNINGQPIRGMDEIARIVERSPVGAKLNITVNREGTELQQQVVLGRSPHAKPTGKGTEDLPQPGPDPSAILPPGPRLGVRTLPVTEEARAQNNLPRLVGALIVSVAAGTPADRAGVPVGAVITAVDGQPVATPQELAAAIRSGPVREVELRYLVAGEEFVKRVQLAGDALSADRPKLELRGRPQSSPTGNEMPDGPTLPAPDDDRVAALEARILELEARIEKLEAAQTPAAKDNAPTPEP